MRECHRKFVSKGGRHAWVDNSYYRNMISAYLYGTLEPPADLIARVRDGDDSTPNFPIDVASYMQSVGRFTSVFQTSVVQSFLTEI